jgi:hypothetical protein
MINIYDYKFPTIKKIIHNIFYTLCIFILCTSIVLESNNIYKFIF